MPLRLFPISPSTHGGTGTVAEGLNSRTKETVVVVDVAQPMRRWEPVAVFLATFALMLVLVPQITSHLSPITGDEPFYLMTDISIIKDGDLNECNNYRQRDEAWIYPDFYSKGTPRPAGWQGWTSVPYPLPPHPAQLVPASRICLGANQYTPIDATVPPPSDGSGSELCSRHGLGLSLLVLPAFALGGYTWVVYFLISLAALLAANVYLLAREGTRRVWPAVLTWAAFAFTVPQLPY